MKIFVYERPWALLPEVLERLRAGDVAAQEFSAEIFAARALSASRSVPSGGGIAVLPLYGLILRRMGFFGTSMEIFTQMLRHAVADPQVSSIIIDVDSPGGEVPGTPELAAEILAARAEKKIVAAVNGQAGSAAYWLASMASEVVASPSSTLGSIGVYALHMDISKATENAGMKPTFISAGKFKLEGNEFEPLTEEAIAATQQRVDEFYGMFVRDVARGRGVSMKAVRDGFGEGRMVTASSALRLGMVDRVATLDETILRLAKSIGRASAVGGRACAVCCGTGRTVAIENGIPKILNEDCPGCAGTGEAVAEVPADVLAPAERPSAAKIPAPEEIVTMATVAEDFTAQVEFSKSADDLRSSAVSIEVQRENDRARLRLLELT